MDMLVFTVVVCGAVLALGWYAGRRERRETVRWRRDMERHNWQAVRATWPTVDPAEMEAAYLDALWVQAREGNEAAHEMLVRHMLADITPA